MFSCLGVERYLAYIVLGWKAALAKAFWSGQLKVAKPLAMKDHRVVIEADLLCGIVVRIPLWPVADSGCSHENVPCIVRILLFELAPPPLIVHKLARGEADWRHRTPLAPGRCARWGRRVS